MISRQTQGNLSPIAPKPAPLTQEKKERALGCSLSLGRELFGNRVHPPPPRPPAPPPASCWVVFWSRHWAVSEAPCQALQEAGSGPGAHSGALLLPTRGPFHRNVQGQGCAKPGTLEWPEPGLQSLSIPSSPRLGLHSGQNL